MTETLPSPTTLDAAAVDPATRAQDDLYRHVNGRWLSQAQIPDDKPIIGAFRTLADQAEAAVRDIITTMSPDSADADEARIAGLYASFMDENRLEALGVSPLMPMLAEVDATTNFVELTEVLGRLGRQGVDWLAGVSAEADPGNPGVQVLFVSQSGLGLPDEAYYRLEEHAETKAAYRQHLQTMFGLVGLDDPAGQADRVLDLETRIAACHWDRVRTRDMRAMYNPMSLADLAASAAGLELPRFFAAAGIEESALGTLVNAQPSFFTDVAELAGGDVEAWKSWARWNVIGAFASYLSADIVAESFRFYGTVLTGTPRNRDRWKRGVSLVEGSLGEAVGRIYVERHFSPRAKERMDELVADLVEAYRRSITALEWMTPATKEKALEKLGKFRPKIGFPAKWRDYSSMTITPDDLIGNVRQAREYAVRRMLDKVGKPVDPDEWFMTPQTVNAYYHPLRNEIVFPAAILRPPFFDEDVDDAVNFGGIGAVIGHEIGHGFDDQGSTCDGDGRLLNWWTDEDRAAFESRTTSLIEQYNALEPAQTPGRHVNGELTIGENIGDLGGLSIALKAWQLAADRSGEAPVVDGLTPQQRLFMSWATVWQTKMRDETMINRLATDPHSPPEFRCNQIVRNIDAFHEAFEVSSGDAMWLPQEDRVSIW